MNLNVDHPYYTSENNYYTNDQTFCYGTLDEFLENWGDADIDYNQIFRWDIKPSYDDDETKLGAQVTIIQQRKGIYCCCLIESIEKSEFDKFREYLTPHWENMKKLWEPLSQI